MPGAKSPIDFRKWFDRFQPQTLQAATWFLYISGAFMLIFISDVGTWTWVAQKRYGYGLIVVLALIACHALGGLLMANDRKLGYWLALVAAFSPFAGRIWAMHGLGYTTTTIVTGGNTIGFILDVALIALLLHPTSREHQRVWYK